MSVITDVNLINETTVVPVYTVFRDGTMLHPLSWDSLALALPNKLNMRFVKTERFVRQSGVVLSESATRIINISSGIIWHGATNAPPLDAINSTSDSTSLWYHNAGVWTRSQITQYNNTQYDDGTNLVTL